MKETNSSTIKLKTIWVKSNNEGKFFRFWFNNFSLNLNRKSIQFGIGAWWGKVGFYVLHISFNYGSANNHNNKFIRSVKYTSSSINTTIIIIVVVVVISTQMFALFNIMSSANTIRKWSIRIRGSGSGPMYNVQWLYYTLNVFNQMANIRISQKAKEK